MLRALWKSRPHVTQVGEVSSEVETLRETQKTSLEIQTLEQK